MILLSGPRQVGKTTIAKAMADCYLNWDRRSDRAMFLKGEDEVAKTAGLDVRRSVPPVVVFDEIHHYPKWRQFLKGFFDTYGENARTLVTGSARLDLRKRGKGDSLMGRYFPFRMHPLSVGEILRPQKPEGEISRPEEISEDAWRTLVEFGGFPEMYSSRSAAFATRWRRLRREQLVRIDIANETGIRDLDQLDALAEILSQRSGQQIVYSSLASEVQTNEVTARQWITTLSSFFYGFTVRPWFRNVANSIRKTPKWYLRDWSGIKAPGARSETMMACHLLKAVETWTDLGFGDYGLFYVRDKNKNEVDFLVAKDGEPWMLVEVKTSETSLSTALVRMQSQLSVGLALQVVLNLDFDDVDSFVPGKAAVVPMRTFLSQLP
ncbi:MAG: ATP-binding protein [Kiritimatiellae bacterium]|nr:ATP-binding protein [Kiritimatiellia bacterium]